ncbi:MAG: MerR family transcriptional regulator [Rikenellaceae bacterium]
MAVESKKIYYTMGELVEMFDVSASLIRHWERQFDIIKPQRNKKGNRLFTPADVENFKLIYHLVKERGMTLEGAKRSLKRGSMVEGSALERDALIMERLQHLRSMLVEMKSAIDDRGDDTIDLYDGTATSLRGRNDSDREPDAESRELFAFYEQRLF